jgi:uncharacterized protein
VRQSSSCDFRASAGTPWRRSLITGASSGIGEAFADNLGAAGVDLVLVARDLSALERVATRNRARGVEVVVLCADLSIDSGVDAVVDAIQRADPMIDLLVNSAGIGRGGAFMDLSLAEVVETMRVNNDALVRLTRAALPRMLAVDFGSVIQISSSASGRPVPGHALYCASKALVTNFGQALSYELADSQVNCTTALVGYTRTRHFERNQLTRDVPVGRFASPEQVVTQILDATRRRRRLAFTGASPSWVLWFAARAPGLTDSIGGRMLRRLRGKAINAWAKRPTKR